MTTNAAPLIILDRDGVINFDSDHYIKSPDEWQPIPGSLEAIARLTHLGWHVAVATNQSGVERGLFDINVLHAIHNKMNAQVIAKGGRIDAIFFCPHAPSSGCNCRKPAPGLLLDIAARYGRSLKGIHCVGDSLRDLEAAAAMQCQPWLVLTGKGEKTRSENPNLPAGTKIVADLSQAVDQILTAQVTAQLPAQSPAQAPAQGPAQLPAKSA
jgi:D-glycero-D-manno-heptose 1,7-bisphosphate phosphatase